MDKQVPLINREISWLYFNDRVLQEAADPTVPLIDRIRFLAIFSSNLDEFYRVRVATLSRLAALNEKSKEILGYNPKKILNQIKNIVVRQERKFNNLYENIIVKQLAEEKIFILNDKQLNVTRGTFVKNYFREKLLATLVPIMLNDTLPLPELRDRAVYFFVKLTTNKKTRFALIEFPDNLSRFVKLPDTNNLKFIILLDDIIRYSLEDIFFIFEHDSIEAYSIQLTRDAELDLDKEVSEKFVDSLAKSLQKRKKGKPMRLLYDSEMPMDMLKYLVGKMGLHGESLIPGNRYHNFKNFIAFPNVGGPELEYSKYIALPVADLSFGKSLIGLIAKKDYLVSTPYQSYDYVIHFLREAAIDPKVKEISIAVYRLAENSRVVHALINAAKNGKKVNCLVELRARFDEQNNIHWSNRLEEEGVTVLYGVPGYKVHSKICLVSRTEKGKLAYYACLSTGNFNEKTAQIYADHTLFTANKRITDDLVNVFKAINKGLLPKGLKSLIVSPIDSRPAIYRLIDNEIKNAKAGKQAYMILKMNSLADEEMISKLYQASNAGVKIKMIIRGMCCLIAGVKGYSENIEVISIVDKYLEHARVHIYCNGGKELIYLTSADFMTRNIDNRVEVGFPIYDEKLQQEIRDIIDIQLEDNTKAREINSQNTNKYHKTNSPESHRAQIEIYNYLKNKTK
ncbi:MULTISPECIES: polyphosphate kinase 1 [Mucilaginibacter]|jgi:polyphosphate kinase|uniref:Polyphosphate kinase n=1 Tax=Mucilaginibacter rubeus TaxID=2027860 RepID=A0AAE6JF79_9SPHI|nr:MULTISPECIES: polyphosphate kinase 1 [Mucilaginibacter]QEM03960.1 polyphosphate kinase 1 [Mucilaginibacter rubeus]QEM16569.1 polyphosphate kinase 1 [Mucilaginibacter gossypii]QTE40657.1 polyphosphate kinase 1 [Mucilaginibacter rubeus]QTE47259.1 polyphosphate kinase 1 [Mucilaginibacter rubeus]QTE58652.1 polyphosphate kinase 1 [Mucilaginibacter rubeus]